MTGGFPQAFVDWIEGFSEFDATAEEFIDANDHQAAVRVHQRAVGSESGIPIEADFWHVYSRSDEKIVRLDMYPHQADAYEAIGLAR
jgi:ketosteroid isomerase-like protein